jgi:nucleotide-binding universal stress UspA family protein
MTTEHPTATNEGRIVVGVDGSRSSKDALRWAARQSELTGTPLLVVTTWQLPVSYGWAAPFPSDYDPALDAKTMLEATIDAVLGSADEARLETAIVEGHPAHVLEELSKSASLVVVGCRGHGEFAGMLLGSVSEHLVTHAHCPVVVTRTT